MGKDARERNLFPVSRPRLKVRAGHLTPYPYNRTALPSRTPRRAKFAKLPLSKPLSLPAGPEPAPVVVVHERSTQLGASAVSVPKGTGTAGTSSEPSSIGSCGLLVSGLENSEVLARRSGPLCSSSRSDERFRGRQGDEASSASVPEGTVASDVLPLQLALVEVGWCLTLRRMLVRKMLMGRPSVRIVSGQILSDRGANPPRGSESPSKFGLEGLNVAVLRPETLATA
eukprot:2789000-Pleurochrysis_carterae.AAC.2